MAVTYDPNPGTVIVQRSVLGFGINTLNADGIRTKNVIFTAPILKMNELVAVQYNESSHSFKCETASSIKEIAELSSSEISLKPKYCGFTADIKKCFANEHRESTNTVYTKVIAQRVLRREYFQKQNFKENLDNAFSADLNTLSPNDLFRKYGTHVIVEAYYGGCLDMLAVTYSDLRKTTKELKSEIKDSFNDICSTSDCDKWKHGTKVIVDISSFYFSAWGGKECPDISLTKLRYKEWFDSIENNVEFCGVPSENSLLPIWELTDNPERRKELEDYYNKCANNDLDSIAEFDRYIVDLKIVVGENESTAKANANTLEKGYNRIDVDLNKGCGFFSDYVYLCYKLGSKKDAITNILCTRSSDKQKAEQVSLKDGKGRTALYDRMRGDLNKGARGDHIYLNVTRDPNYKPIRRVDVCVGESIKDDPEWQTVTWNNSSLAADANKGAGGDYIYIRVKR